MLDSSYDVEIMDLVYQLLLLGTQWQVSLCEQSIDAIPLETVESNANARREMLDEIEDDDQQDDDDDDDDDEDNDVDDDSAKGKYQLDDNTQIMLNNHLISNVGCSPHKSGTLQNV